MTEERTHAATWVVEPEMDALAREAADRFVATASAAIEERGVFRVALSGGTTPNAVFPYLRQPPRVAQGRLESGRVLLG